MGSLLMKKNYKYIKSSNTFFLFNKDFNIYFLSKKITFYFEIFLSMHNFIIFYFKNNFIFHVQKMLNKKLRKNFLFLYCNFVYAKIFLMVGLGFKKKYYDIFNFYCMDVGRRKWVIFKLEPVSFFFNLFRKNICILTNSKKNLNMTLLRLKCLRRETVFKVKGIMTNNRIIFSKKISRSILFARRVKFKKLKLKPTKKQKLKK